MALIVVGGQSRNLGKTSVVVGLITALRERRWTAVKITQFGHGFCSARGEPCHCSSDLHTTAISEERDAAGRGDTCRFLRAGAQRSLWVRVKQGHLCEAMPVLRQRLADASNVVIESNSVLEFLEPDLYLTVLDARTEDFKASARRFLDRASAVVLRSGNSAPRLDWPEARERPIFHVRPPEYVSDDLIAFVRERLTR